MRHPYIAKFNEWWLWKGPRVTIITAFVLVNAGVWIYGYCLALGVDPAPYYPYAKGFGKTLNVNCSFILITVLRNTLCWLRSTPLADVIPLDDNIAMHKLVFAFIAVGGIMHAVFHYLDFGWNEQRYGVSTGHQAFANLAGVTGHLIALMMLCMFLSAVFMRKYFTFRRFRFDGYRTFLLVHKLWMPCFVLLWLHGPMFWAFSLWPLAFIGLEKLVQKRRAKVDVVVIDSKIVGQDILALKMKMQGKRKFNYKAGQYLFLNCPDITELEWHPFTITSAPEEAHFSCHIRARPDMDWCYKLRTLLGHARTEVVPKEGRQSLVVRPVVKKSGNLEAGEVKPAKEDKAQIMLRVDGPYGSPSEEVFDHSTVVLVGAGIGVTPFISILKSMTIRVKQREGLSKEARAEQQRLKIHFFWVCRDEQELSSFKDLIDAVISNADLKDHVVLNTYTTGVWLSAGPFGVICIAVHADALLRISQELNLKKVTLHAYNQYSGKPNWGRILKEIAGAHQGEEIGVFMCGPLPLAHDLNLACKRQNHMAAKGKPGDKENRTIFKFKKENF
ncbi:ferric reductase NAD binding domain-containing protein [Fimicolochytrium jonesii]|uniref:ferric reductase NAD binding domain-containing protein n=1 Tax=Fimicolochytrium jonesii TaxID=1396493 RepID=UPI0022FDF344|nr:ferric reductase NAD binding domain-containing protein [Fimicolochytrium jonesii]KAI8819388.1 ferric reductase NAD binding domain-containing protein [Fimicolochytrium jonesii]